MTRIRIVRGSSTGSTPRSELDAPDAPHVPESSVVSTRPVAPLQPELNAKTDSTSQDDWNYE
eukprot:4439446-Pyramimonas_sp.AAC.1